VFRKAVSSQRIERNVDAPLLEVARYILPEIRELQGRARRVRKPLALRIAIPAQIEHETPHRIRGITAVSKYIVPGLVPAHALVLAKRDEKVGKRLHGNIE